MCLFKILVMDSQHDATTAEGELPTEAARQETAAESSQAEADACAPRSASDRSADGVLPVEVAGDAEPQNADLDADEDVLLDESPRRREPHIAVIGNTATRSPPKLLELCLRTMGTHLKYFCNMLLYPADAPRLSKSFDIALSPYDLAPFALLDDQRCLQQIATWKKLRLKAKRASAKGVRSESTPLYAVAADVESRELDPLRSLLGIPPRLPFVLRQLEPHSASAKKLRRREKKWVSGTENRSLECVNAAALDLEVESEPSNIREIKMAREAVTNVGCGFMSALIMSHSNLTVIHLQSCQITCAGAILLANAVKISSSITRLDLSNDGSRAFPGRTFKNDIRGPGTIALATALTTNRSMVFLSLSGNYVGDEGALALSNSIRINPTLRCLDLSRTQTNGAAEELIRVFHQSKTMETLNLQWCCLRPGLGSQLAIIQAAKNRDS